jgi:predicted permease
VDLLTDIRFGARRLLRDRGFTCAAIVALGLGIAATNSAFAVVNGLFFRAMPFADPERVVELGQMSHLDLLDFRAAASTFEAMAGSDERPVILGDEARPAERRRAAFVSANTFALLGRPPALGRDFRAEDEREGAARVVLLGHDIWRTRYGADPQVVGRPVRIDGVPATIIGVMPAGFAFPQNAGLWLPLSALPATERGARQSRLLDGFGRLRPGTTHAQAMADLGRVDAVLARTYPDLRREAPPRVAPYRSGVTDTRAAIVFLLLFGVVGIVLLIACANVANLLLARAAARIRDVSVHMALGAGRWRIVRALLVESILLAFVAGLAALPLCVAVLRLLARALSSSATDAPPYWLEFPVDASVLAVLLATCLGTAIVFGLAPALHTSNVRFAGVLAEAGRTAIGHRRSRRWTAAIVATQLALAVVLLGGATAIVRNLVALGGVDPGVETNGLVRLTVDLPAVAYASAERRELFHRDLAERLGAIPGVRAALATAVPGRDAREMRVSAVTGGGDPGDRAFTAIVETGPGYFDVLGVGPHDGRALRNGDTSEAVVNERFAERYLGGRAPLGQAFRLDDEDVWRTVVGVVANVRQNVGQDVEPFEPVVYLPLTNTPFRTTILARADSDLTPVAAAVSRIVRDLDADVALSEVRTVSDDLANALWPQRFFGSVFVSFAAIAAILAAVGLAAVTAYATSSRTREIGLRVALGARPGQVWWFVTSGAARQLGAGLLVGTAGAAALGRVLPAFMFGTTAGDPLTLALVAVLLTCVGLLAAVVPARRALRVNPVTALRAE